MARRDFFDSVKLWGAISLVITMGSAILWVMIDWVLGQGAAAGKW